MNALVEAFQKMASKITEAFGVNPKIQEGDEEGMKKLRMKSSRLARLAYILSVSFLVAVVCALVFYVNKIEEKELEDIRAEIRETKLMASASLKASEDINYYGSIILEFDNLTGGKLDENSVKEIAFRIYSLDRQLAPLCGFRASHALAIIQNESAGDPRAISPVNDRGLWQLHDTTGQRVFQAVGFGTLDYIHEVYDPIKNTIGAIYPGFAYTDSVLNSAVEIEKRLRGEQSDQN